jgi:hypothetical protein
MSKASGAVSGDDLRAEYDFASMTGGVRGKYVKRYRQGVNLALLDPEVAEAFPTDAAVNEALRTVLRATKAQRRAKRLPNKRMQQTKRGRKSTKSSRRR